MYYVEYLISLCQRRQWAEPVYDTMYTKQGWLSRVRVNNREYTTEEPSESEKLAQDRAAESAYNICFNFSVNDGMYPGQRAGQAGITQGLPVAIGTGRGRNGGKHRSGAERERRRRQEYMGVSAYEGSVGSRDSSPRTSESDLEHPYKASRRSSSSSTGSGITHSVCVCGRGYVMKHHARCAYCIHEISMYRAWCFQKIPISFLIRTTRQKTRGHFYDHGRYTTNYDRNGFLFGMILTEVDMRRHDLRLRRYMIAAFSILSDLPTPAHAGTERIYFFIEKKVTFQHVYNQWLHFLRIMLWLMLVQNWIW